MAAAFKGTHWWLWVKLGPQSLKMFAANHPLEKNREALESRLPAATECPLRTRLTSILAWF